MLGYEIEHLWVHVEHPAADQIAASWYRKQTAPSFDLLLSQTKIATAVSLRGP
jgi:hypothetical protein